MIYLQKEKLKRMTKINKYIHNIQRNKYVKLKLNNYNIDEIEKKNGHLKRWFNIHVFVEGSLIIIIILILYSATSIVVRGASQLLKVGTEWLH